MTSDDVTSNVHLDPVGRIAQDLHCLHCGYNLRTLTSNQLCPECGRSVAHSMHGDLLVHCNPQWVAQLASGTLWLLWSTILGYIWLMLSIPLGPSAKPIGGIIGVVVAYGYWQVTSPEPKELEGKQSLSMRRIARYLSLVSLLLVFLPAPVLLSRIAVPTIHIAPRAVIVIWGWLLILFRVSRLARRIPRPDLAAKMMWVVAGIAVGAAAPLICALVFHLLPSSQATVAFQQHGDLAKAAGTCSLVAAALLLWSLKLLFDCRKQLIICARASQRLATTHDFGAKED